MGLRRAIAAFVCVAAVAGCGSEDAPRDLARERLDAADRALARHPRDPRAMEEVILAAHAGAGEQIGTAAGIPTERSRPYFQRAAAVWPGYLRATRNRPRPAVAAVMVQVYGNGLNRPRDAARAALRLTEARPSSDAYLQLMVWSTRAGDIRRARLAGQSALELAEPRDRERVQEAIRGFGPPAP